MSLAPPVTFDAYAPWQLSAEVSLRDEAFGALAYHHGNRRLVFLKSPALVDIVRDLENYHTAADAIGAHVASSQQGAYERALASLARSEIIHGR